MANMTSSVSSVFSNLSNAALMRELIVIVLVLAVAVALARLLRHRQAARAKLQEQGEKRLAFPLIAILLLAVLRFANHYFGWHMQLIGVAIQLAVALAGVRIVVFALRNAFAPSGWLASFERTLATLIWMGVALDLIGVLPELITWLDSFQLHIGKNKVSCWQILQGLATIVVTAITAMWLGGVAEGRLQAINALDVSLRVVLARAIKSVLLIVAVLFGMSLIGMDITTLSVFGGALGVGLGFGLQKIASNYVSGFMILLDRSIRIGDLIQLGAEQRGEVMQITTRYTVLRSLSGSHFIVPNEMLVSTVVQNESFTHTRLRVGVMIPVAHGQDIEHALQLMETVASETPRVLAEPAPRAHLAEFTDSGIKLELAAWIDDPVNGTLEVRSNIQRAVLARFRVEGIEMPQPQKAAAAKPLTPTILD